MGLNIWDVAGPGVDVSVGVAVIVGAGAGAVSGSPSRGGTQYMGCRWSWC